MGVTIPSALMHNTNKVSHWIERKEVIGAIPS